MRFETKHVVSAVTLTAALMLPAVVQAQPGHGMPPPGQARHDRDRDGIPNRYDRQPNRPNWHFDQGHRDQWQQHYRQDAMRWRNNSRRPNFTPGYVIPRNYAIRPVPSSYYAGMAAPPPGYRYGYYDGYVVAYDPTTRVIADVMDLVAGLASR